jgi:hypothetical protein
VIERVDLGICPAYDYTGDGPAAVAFPGAMLGGMPSLWYAFEPLLANGWRIVLVWAERAADRSSDPWQWVGERARAAAEYAGGADLLITKSVGTLAVRAVEAPAVCLTPLLDDPDVAEALRSRTTLLVGGTADPAWDGALARGLSDDVLELDGADHGLARVSDAPRIGEAVAAFSARLRA